MRLCTRWKQLTQTITAKATPESRDNARGSYDVEGKNKRMQDERKKNVEQRTTVNHHLGVCATSMFQSIHCEEQLQECEYFE